MTKKERHKHYKLMHKKFKNKTYPNPIIGGFCDGSSCELFGGSFNYRKINAKMFPEYYLFNPENELLYWFGNCPEARLIALEFCIAMTKS